MALQEPWPHDVLTSEVLSWLLDRVLGAGGNHAVPVFLTDTVRDFKAPPKPEGLGTRVAQGEGT